MKLPRNGFAGGLLAGTLIGLILGTSAVSLAEFKKSGWQRFNGMFRAGYVAGFNDAIRIAKNRAAGSYLDVGFPLPVEAKVSDWLKTINKLYQKKEYEQLAVSQLIQLAGKEMMEEFGPDVSVNRMAILHDFVQKRQEAAVARAKQRKAQAQEDKAAGVQPPDPQDHPKVKMMKARRENLATLGFDENYWEDTGARLKRGYVIGFNDCVYVAKTADDASFVAKTYELPNAGFKQWRRALNGFYDDIPRQAEPRLVAIAHAGRAVKAKHGEATALDEQAAAVRLKYLQEKLSEGAFGEPATDG